MIRASVNSCFKNRSWEHFLCTKAHSRIESVNESVFKSNHHAFVNHLSTFPLHRDPNFQMSFSRLLLNDDRRCQTIILLIFHVIFSRDASKTSTE